ncbi:MAG: helix-turn-helix transcriptional regulator [Clostridia bacterium]|nr:helix-turn-helix transcriptional regulator [Clostridia bacterium]MBQ8637490.1 helix-turn-helix transcriptional regulator [Clostridia bacterium]
MKQEYVKSRVVNLINVTRIVSIHYYELGKNFNYEGESHDFWELVYVDAGQVDIIANERSVHLKQGEIIFHRPNEFHSIKTTSNTVANVFVISFVSSSEAMSFFNCKQMTVSDKQKKYLSSLMDECEQTFHLMDVQDVKLIMRENPPIAGPQMVKMALEQLLIMLIRNEQISPNPHIFPTKESMDNHLVSQMISIIEEHIFSRISVEEICNKLGYSRAYLSKIFKVTTGYTISKYILRKKIKEAKKLIREDKYNFTQISELLAFDNPHYFSRAFRRAVNMSPSEYKKSVK